MHILRSLVIASSWPLPKTGNLVPYMLARHIFVQTYNNSKSHHIIQGKNQVREKENFQNFFGMRY